MRKRYKKVTKEMKEVMQKMRVKGFTYVAISKVLNLSESTVKYHLDPDSKKKAIKRAMKNEKPRDRKEYQREYRSERYDEDEEFRERIKKHSRNYWRRKRGDEDE